MQPRLITKLLPALSIPFALVLALTPLSYFTRGNPAVLIIFFFIITPALAEYLPKIITKRSNTLAESLGGMLIFYGFMVFMIYKSYQSDFFAVMIASCAVNMITIRVIFRIKKSMQVES
jgi:hypothetical protein